MKRLTIHVRNPALREEYTQSFKGPVLIGRASDNDIQIDERESEASRYHAEIFSDGTRLYLRDRSLNGTVVSGREIRDQTVEIRPGEPFSITNYEFVVSVPSDFTLRHTDRYGRPLSTFDLVAGGGVAAVRRDGVITCEQVSSLDEVRRRFASAECCVYFTLDGETPTLSVIANRTPDQAVMVNRIPIEGNSARLNSLDVIYIGDERLDLVVQGEEVLVCGNVNCTQLVPYVVQGQCKFCGQDLHAGQTCLVRL
ncbi:MAG: hypothetical protein Kow0032_11580 [Methyloligellaceae bacterium]